jgi:hypothetical protein
MNPENAVMQDAAMDAPHNLKELLDAVWRKCESDGSLTPSNVLLSLLREHHFWPALQVKKFFTEPGLVLLHNTYKRVDVSHFKELYDECRSVVLDMDAPAGQNVIVSFADHIPDRLVDSQYEAVATADDSCTECFEGTVVTVYHYKNKWHFGTSSCPTINSSRFRHPTATHGDMLDEALAEIFPMEEEMMSEEGVSVTKTLRETFASHLDTGKAYAFVLVHHLNCHTTDYTHVFGAEYAKLIHIATRDRATLAVEDIRGRPLEHLGIKYPRTFDTPTEALTSLRDGTMQYGFLAVTRDGTRFKVSRGEIVHREECDLGSGNPWVNMLWVFMQNRPDYHVQNYQEEFAKDLVLPLDARGRSLSPTYLIYTCVCNMRDLLYQLYCNTTAYFPAYRRFKMNRDIDQTFPAIVRFHLAQLRHVQVQHHHHAFLSKKAVYHYLCFHQTLKNVRALVQFFAENEGYFPGRAQECFRVLHAMLSAKA